MNAAGLLSDDLSSSAVAWPTPDTLNRKSARALTSSTENGRRSGGGQSSPPGLEQVAEMAMGEMPREMPPPGDLPPATRALVASLFPSSPPAPPTAPPGPPSSPPGPTSPPLWPTPVQEDSQVTGWRPNKDASGQSLNATAQLWPTPRGQDAKHQGPTDYELTLGPESGNSRLLHVRIGQLTGEKRRLNPRFVAWLMGLPPAWLDAQSSCGQVEMASYRCRLRMHLACLLGDSALASVADRWGMA